MSLKQFTTIIISRAGILYRWWPKPKNQTSSNSDGRPELLYIQSLIIPQRVLCLDLPLSLCLSIKASYFLILLCNTTTYPHQKYTTTIKHIPIYDDMERKEIMRGEELNKQPPMLQNLLMVIYPIPYYISILYFLYSSR